MSADSDSGTTVAELADQLADLDDDAVVTSVDAETGAVEAVDKQVANDPDLQALHEALLDSGVHDDDFRYVTIFDRDVTVGFDVSDNNGILMHKCVFNAARAHGMEVKWVAFRQRRDEVKVRFTRETDD